MLACGFGCLLGVLVVCGLIVVVLELVLSLWVCGCWMWILPYLAFAGLVWCVVSLWCAVVLVVLRFCGNVELVGFDFVACASGLVACCLGVLLV